MTRRTLLLANAVAAITIAAASALLTIPHAARAKDTVTAQNTTESQPDLSGTWKLDPAHSDDPSKMMPGRGDRGGPGGDGERGPRGGGRTGGPGGGRMDGPGGGPGGRPMGGPMRMPVDFALVQLPSGIELRDSLGVVFQRVIVTGGGDVAPVDSAGVAQLRGTWQGQDLEAQAKGPRGGTMDETYSLTDGGKTLKISTKLQFTNSRPPVAFTRSYVKVGG